ncbi:MAG: DUF4403 family protein [Sandaracinaceae bacterium]|nr:DUF4403 family protein [Sandaracinaceae bacterium]
MHEGATLRLLLRALGRVALGGVALCGLALGSLALGACGSVHLTAAAPPRATSAPLAALEPEPSVLPAQLAVDVSAIVAGLAPLEGVPLEVDPSEPPEPEVGAWTPRGERLRHRVRVTVGAPRAFSREDGAIELEVPLEVSAVALVGRGRRLEVRGCGCGGAPWCGGGAEAPRAAHLRARARLDADARFHLVPTLESDAGLDEPCVLDAVGAARPIDLGAAIAEALEPLRARLEAAARDAIARSDALEVRARELWASLSRPLPVASAPPSSLHLRPEAIAPEGLGGDGARLALRVRVTLRPTQAAPDAEPAPRPLPALAGEPPDAAALSIAAVTRVATDELSRAVRAGLVGRRYRDAPRRVVRVVDAEIYGATRGAIVRVELAGAISGNVYARGALALDEATREVFLDQLALEPASARELARLFDELELPNTRVRRAPWLDRERLVRDIAAASRWSLDAPRADLRAAVLAALRSLEATRGARLDGAQLVELRLEPGALVAATLLRGGLEAPEAASPTP